VGKETVGHNQAAAAAGPGGVPSWVGLAAKQVAANMGEPRPASVQVVATTRRPAAQLDAGSWVDSDQPIYFVVLQGHFADTNARTPDGRTIYGAVLTLSMDDSTREITGLGLSNRVPPIAELGTVTDITDQP
jgi:hypothetical protein